MQPPLGLRERQKRERRERIAVAARRLFARRGYHNVTTQEVAAAADIGTGTLFRYAASKGELLMMVVVEAYGGVDAADHDSGDAVADVLGLLEAMLTAVRSRPTNALAFQQELLFGAPGPQRDRALDLADQILAALETILGRHPRTPDAADTPTLARVVAHSCFMEVVRAGTETQRLSDIDRDLAVVIHAVLTGHLADLPPTAPTTVDRREKTRT